MGQSSISNNNSKKKRNRKRKNKESKLTAEQMRNLTIEDLCNYIENKPNILGGVGDGTLSGGGGEQMSHNREGSNKASGSGLPNVHFSNLSNSGAGISKKRAGTGPHSSDTMEDIDSKRLQK